MGFEWCQHEQLMIRSVNSKVQSMKKITHMHA